MQSEYELAFQDNAFFSLPFLHALKRDLDMVFDMDHEEVVHEMVHLIEIERLSRGKKLYRFGDEENGGSLFDRVQHEIYSQQKVADAIQAFYEDEDSPTLANLHELQVSALVLRAFKKMIGKNDVSYVNLEIATIERCEANMWGMQGWYWKERYQWVREEFEKYMTSSSVSGRVDELAAELMRLHDTWAKTGAIDWEGN